MKKMMVVGASGVLGTWICLEVLRIFTHNVSLVVSDYKADRGKNTAVSLGEQVQFRLLDITHKESIEQAVCDIDLVIVSAKQQQPLIQHACIKHQVRCIDVTVFYDFVCETRSLHYDAVNNEIGSIVMSGFFPGLSGLIVKKAVSPFSEITEVNVGLLQSTNAKAGVSGIIDMLRMISQDVRRHDGQQSATISGFKIKRNMMFSSSLRNRKVRLIEHAERAFLREILQVEQIHYWTAWNNNMFNIFVGLLKRSGILARILKFDANVLVKYVKHNPVQPEEASLTIEVKGVIGNQQCVKTFVLSTFSDYHTTAMFTAALAKIAINKEISGVVFPFEITDIDEILSIMDCSRITLTEAGISCGTGIIKKE